MIPPGMTDKISLRPIHLVQWRILSAHSKSPIALGQLEIR